MSDKTYDQPPEFNLDPEKNYKAIIEMDNGNKITIDLLSKEAPKTVNNFVFLARDGYYDGITFQESSQDLWHSQVILQEQALVGPAITSTTSSTAMQSMIQPVYCLWQTAG